MGLRAAVLRRRIKEKALLESRQLLIVRRFSLSLRPGWLPVGAWVEVYDAVGRQVHLQPLRAGVNSVGLAGQPGGVYVWRVVQRGRLLGVGKIVKL